MGDPLSIVGVAASVVQLADFGLKLSVKLYNFSHTVWNADSTMKEMSNEVSLTSAVLKELVVHMKQDDQGRLVSEEAVRSAEKTVKECLKVFQELDDALTKSLENLSRSRGAKALEKFKWAFVESKTKVLRSNLDRLRDQLSFMLEVIRYAKDVRERGRNSTFELQEELIKALKRAQDESERNYALLKKALEEKDTSHMGVSRRDSLSSGLSGTSTMINIVKGDSSDSSKENHIDLEELPIELQHYYLVMNSILKKVQTLDGVLEREELKELENGMKEAHIRLTRKLETKFKGLAWKVADEILGKYFPGSDPSTARENMPVTVIATPEGIKIERANASSDKQDVTDALTETGQPGLVESGRERRVQRWRESQKYRAEAPKQLEYEAAQPRGYHSIVLELQENDVVGKLLSEWTTLSDQEIARKAI